MEIPEKKKRKQTGQNKLTLGKVDIGKKNIDIYQSEKLIIIIIIIMW